MLQFILSLHDQAKLQNKQINTYILYLSAAPQQKKKERKGKKSKDIV